MPANAGDAGLIPGLERSPGEVTATHSSILAWKLPWTEEPDGLQIMGLQESDTTEHAHIHMYIHVTKGKKRDNKATALNAYASMWNIPPTNLTSSWLMS